MAGTAGPAAPSSRPRSKALIFGVVAVIAATVVLAGISYYLFTQSPPLPANTSPRILGIIANPSSGSTSTVFTVTAQVVDVQDPVRAIQVHWDWQNDGVWDTPWSTNKSATHVFADPGNYTVRCEAKDSGGLTGSATRVISVALAPPAPLRIGTIFSLTGALQAFGMDQQNAVDLAVEEIDGAGGVLGQPIQVFHADDATNPTVAANAAMTLVAQNHVDAIIGATGSAMCAAVLPIAQSNAIPEISPSCASPRFTNESYTGGWFARTVASDELQGAVGASFAHVNLSFAYSAVLGINNVYGVKTSAAYADNFTRLGGAITSGSPRIVNEIGGSTSDYTTDLHAILDVTPAPQVVYVVAYPLDGQVLMKDWSSGLGANPGWANVKWIFSEGVYDQAGFIDPLVASGVNVSGFRGTAPAAYAGIFPSGYASWAARYQARFGASPNLFAANAYDAAYLVALAAEAASNVSGPLIRTHIQDVAGPPGTVIGPNQWSLALQEFGAGRSVDYQGASGSVNMNADGNVPSAYIIWAVDNSNRLYTQAFFDEPLVVSILPNGFFPVAAGMPAILDVAVSSRVGRP